jgi:hypothetical protein
MSALDVQVGGNHYKTKKIQPIEIAYEYELTPAVSLALKYLLRYREKNGKQDLLKGIHCLQLALELEYQDNETSL